MGKEEEKIARGTRMSWMSRKKKMNEGISRQKTTIKRPIVLGPSWLID